MQGAKLLHGMPWLALIGLALLPGLFTVGPVIETRFFPVVDNVQIEDLKRHDEGVSFYVRFDKLRPCEFLGVSWYEGAMRRGVAFEPDSALYPRTRPVGDQYAGPWLVTSVRTLDGTHAVAHHRCHPLWVTASPFYP